VVVLRCPLAIVDESRQDPALGVSFLDLRNRHRQQVEDGGAASHRLGHRSQHGEVLRSAEDDKTVLTPPVHQPLDAARELGGVLDLVQKDREAGVLKKEVRILPGPADVLHRIEGHS
jgi:hypothetical protein